MCFQLAGSILTTPSSPQNSNGTQPSTDLDTSFFASLSIQGYVPAAGRGVVAGTATGVSPTFQTVLHWHNPSAQYWAVASPADGAYASPPMKPGTYAVSMYRGEYLVANDTVTVAVPASSSSPSSSTTTTTTARVVATKNLVAADPAPPVVFRIGVFDGRPTELKNGDRIERMHPADVRMSSWGGNYTVGASDPARDFPMALFAKQGGVATVNFRLTAAQISAAAANGGGGSGGGFTLKVGTTLSFKGGRPKVGVNGAAWAGRDPGPPRLIDSRGVTRGAYRGYGEVYTWPVPAGALKAGDNTLTLGVFGSGDQAFLSANYVVDAVELQGPPS